MVWFAYVIKGRTAMVAITNRIKWLLDFRFLPSKFQYWLFQRGTRAIEFISAIGLIGFAVVFHINDGTMYDLPLYHKFAEIEEWKIVATLGVVGCSQLLTLGYSSIKATALSGYMLLIRALISVAFYMSYPPLNTGMVVPPLLAFVCMLAGHNMIQYALMQHDADKK